MSQQSIACGLHDRAAPQCAQCSTLLRWDTRVRAAAYVSFPTFYEQTQPNPHTHTHTHMRAHRYGWIDPHTRQAQHTADSCRPGPKPRATGTRATPTPCCHATDIVTYTRGISNPHAPSHMYMYPHICTCTLMHTVTQIPHCNICTLYPHIAVTCTLKHMYIVPSHHVTCTLMHYSDSRLSRRTATFFSKSSALFTS